MSSSDSESGPSGGMTSGMSLTYSMCCFSSSFSSNGESIRPIGESILPIGEASGPIGDWMGPMGDAIWPIGDGNGGETMGPIGDWMGASRSGTLMKPGLVKLPSMRGVGVGLN